MSWGKNVKEGNREQEGSGAICDIKHGHRREHLSTDIGWDRASQWPAEEGRAWCAPAPNEAGVAGAAGARTLRSPGQHRGPQRGASPRETRSPRQAKSTGGM